MVGCTSFDTLRPDDCGASCRTTSTLLFSVFRRLDAFSVVLGVPLGLRGFFSFSIALFGSTSFFFRGLRGLESAASWRVAEGNAADVSNPVGSGP